ncbi:Hypothetical protein Cul210932_2096 [Corynebacterium ulcerans]|nr:Hypothetical protein Cul210932_2096 [Corynebacterium ulcerans]AIU92621.1 Hypothetical protein Cul05146_2081 [Corynebacterium ulcerans]ALD95804.1 Hypothetical protein Cul131001_2131 [Corynebacterium ulcerans]
MARFLLFTAQQNNRYRELCSSHYVSWVNFLQVSETFYDGIAT